MGFESSELHQFEQDLAKIPERVVPVVRVLTEKTGLALRDRWRDNARQTSGKHAAYYPDSITMSTQAGFGETIVEVGPEVAHGEHHQGFLGYVLEYGGRWSSPHMDGNRAADVEEIAFAAELPTVVAELIRKTI